MLTRITNNIGPILLLGQALLNDNHPASNNIKTYMDTLAQHLDWIKQLIYLLGIHTKHLIDYENVIFAQILFNQNLKEANVKLCFSFSLIKSVNKSKRRLVKTKRVCL